ncbi:hypothetical protein ABPG72_010191 [Tetrahymena utriculariae]
MVLSFKSNQNIQIYQTTQITFQPCQFLPEKQTKTLQFQDLFPNTFQAQRIVLSIWFIPYGYILDQYTIISIHQFNKCIVSVSYNLVLNQLYLQINDEMPVIINTQIQYSYWVQVNLDIQTQPGYLQGQISIQKSQYEQYYSNITQSDNQQLILRWLELNYGNPPQKLQANPSCLVFFLFSVGILSSPTPYTFDEIVSYLSSYNTQISQNYDYFYSQNNQGELVSEVGTFQQRLQIQSQQKNNVISPGNSLETINFDLPLNQLTISFFLKFLQSPPNIQTYFCIYFDSNPVCLQFSQNQIQLGSDFQSYNALEWNNIIFIIGKNIMGETITLVINNSQILQQPYNFYHFRFQIKFFSNDIEYQLNHIRIYSGTLLYNQNNCFLQSSDQSCLVCMDNYLLDFQNKMQCVPKNTENTDYQIKGTKDWNPPRKSCPKNMINDSSSSSGCKCLIGFYLEGDTCMKCPTYCRNCNSLNDCRNNRDSFGNCLDQSAFDDGQKCIIPLFILKERENIRITNQLDYGQLCTGNMDPDINKNILQSSQLNLQATDSFFLSFSILVKLFNLPPLQEIIVAYIQENLNKIVYVTLSFQQINSKKLFYIKLYVKNAFTSQFTFEQDDLAWIAFWTDNLNCIFMVRTKLFNYYDYNISCLQLYSASNTQVCTGICDSIVNNFCLTLNNKPITFIKNIPNPTQNGVEQFFSIYQEDSELLARYKLDLNQIIYQQYIDDSSGNAQYQQPLQFSNNLQKFNQIQGFQLNQNVQAYFFQWYYYYYYQNENLLSISFTLEFDSSNQFKQFILLQQFEGSLIIYLIPDFYQQILYVQLCDQSVCQTFKNAILFFNQTNFFFLYAGIENRLQLQANPFYKIDIICNYIKETFMSRYNNYFIRFNQVEFGDSLNPYYFFIDNINIYQTNVFVYYDYTKTDSCFIYINLNNMQCLYLKRDYLYYNNQVITKQQCIQLFINTAYTPYIIQKDQTCNIRVPQSYQEFLCALIEYINGQPFCTVCKDENYDPQKQCLQCKSHFYFNKQASQCQKCDFQCLECENQSNHCTQCHYLNQITPTCNCIQQNQNLQNTCKCNYKCGSCSIIDNDICFTCSSEKRVLPNCQCDQKYQEIQQECVEIKTQCSEKCLSCVGFSDNCTKCSENRINPPQCQCAYGIQEQKDGSCQICHQGTYYDPQLKICKQCSPQCLSCTHQECHQCMLGFQLQGFFCKCIGQLYQQNTQQIKCQNSFDVTISSFYQNIKYFISLNFSQALKQFDVSDTQLNEIITFYIPEISQEYYSFVNAQYIGNKFQVYLNIKANFQASQVIVILNTNSYFLSQDEHSVLDQKYLKQKMVVDIGPLVLKEQSVKTENLDHFQNQLNQLISENQNAFKVTNQLQLVFYFLNTLQPISGFLLLNASYPPQLYKFYQLTGTFIFPRVPDYSDNSKKMEFSVFGYNIDEDLCEIPNYSKFQQLGFCQSILVNIPILLIKWAYPHQNQNFFHPKIEQRFGDNINHNLFVCIHLVFRNQAIFLQLQNEFLCEPLILILGNIMPFLQYSNISLYILWYLIFDISHQDNFDGSLYVQNKQSIKVFWGTSIFYNLVYSYLDCVI